MYLLVVAFASIVHLEAEVSIPTRNLRVASNPDAMAENPARSLECEQETLQCMQLTFSGEGERVGYAQLHKSSPSVMEIVDLFVEPKSRGKGHGRTILERVLAFARESGFKEIYAHAAMENGPAYGLFRRLGFHACETEMHLERSLG